MLVIQTQVNVLAITNLKLEKTSGHARHLEKFTPTPRAILGDAYTPKAPPFQQIMLDPSNPYRVGSSK